MEDLRTRIEKVLEIIRPYLREDNGGVDFLRFEDDTQTLVLSLTGNCKNCPLSLMTLRAGIEKLIIKNIPEIRRVESE